ncbi:MAG: permease prefix domain 1-containing protein [Chloroflexota bacterium]
MNHSLIENIICSIPAPRRHRRAIATELRTHLDELQCELELAGWDPARAAAESVARLGDPNDILEGFQEVYRPVRRRRLGLAFSLAGALLAGAYGASGTFASSPTSHHRQAQHGRVRAHVHHCKQRV